MNIVHVIYKSMKTNIKINTITERARNNTCKYYKHQRTENCFKIKICI